MLDDNSRKLLQILWNHNRVNEALININELRRLSQRSESNIYRSLVLLRAAGYIDWDPVFPKVRILMKEKY